MRLTATPDYPSNPFSKSLRQLSCQLQRLTLSQKSRPRCRESFRQKLTPVGYVIRSKKATRIVGNRQIIHTL